MHKVKLLRPKEEGRADTDVVLSYLGRLARGKDISITKVSGTGDIEISSHDPVVLKEFVELSQMGTLKPNWRIVES